MKDCSRISILTQDNKKNAINYFAQAIFMQYLKIHYHKKKTEIFYFIKGYGKAIIDGKEIFLKSGTFIIVKPNVRHTFINESENILEAINIKTNNDPKDTYAD